MVYFIADTHFGHENIVKLCNRPFSSLEEMEQTIINNWNKKVTNADMVYIVGDLFWKSIDAGELLRKLKGKKILLEGNHDGVWLKKTDTYKYFVEIAPLINTYIGDKAVTICHYPLIEWKGSRKVGSRKQSYLIHGHIHNKVKPEYSSLFNNDHALNAGVDINNFTPVTLEELIKNNIEFKKQIGEMRL